MSQLIDQSIILLDGSTVDYNTWFSLDPCQYLRSGQDKLRKWNLDPYSGTYSRFYYFDKIRGVSVAARAYIVEQKFFNGPSIFLRVLRYLSRMIKTRRFLMVDFFEGVEGHGGLIDGGVLELFPRESITQGIDRFQKTWVVF